MDLIMLIETIQQIPLIGPVVVYLPPLVLFGSLLAAKLSAPTPSTGWPYRLLWDVVQWCALEKGEASNAMKAAPRQGAAAIKTPNTLLPSLAMLVALSPVLFVALILSACTAPQSARQGIYQAAGGYDVALKAATAYARLPRCGQPASPPLCSDQALVTQASDAAQLALPAVNAAIDTAADTKATDSQLSQSLTAATNAVGAFTAITVKLNMNPGA